MRRVCGKLPVRRLNSRGLRPGEMHEISCRAEGIPGEEIQFHGRL